MNIIHPFRVSSNTPPPCTPIKILGTSSLTSNSLNSQKPDIVFVGAGPIALFSAIQFKLLEPTLNILLLEKYATYQRQNTLILHPKAFEGCQKDDGGQINNILSVLQNHNSQINIQQLEEKLKKIALGLQVNINIIPKTGNQSLGITDVKSQVIQQYPQAKLIIGSDGANSTFRSQMFDEQNIHKETLAFTAITKYTARGKIQPINLFNLYPLAKINNFHRVEETAKYDENTKNTAISITCIIDEETYNLLNNMQATAKNPIKIFNHEENRQAPTNIIEDIKRVIGLQIQKNKIDFDPQEVKLSVNPTPQHYCDSVIQYDVDNHFFKALLGDAALGLSFRKGINAGIQSSIQFTKIITENWYKLNQLPPNQFQLTHFLQKCEKNIPNAILWSNEARPTKYAQHVAVVTTQPKTIIGNYRVRLTSLCINHETAVQSFGTKAGFLQKEANYISKAVQNAYPFHDYQLWYTKFAEEKIEEGNLLRLKYDALDRYLDISNKVPWQIITYSDTEKTSFIQATDNFISVKNTSM